MKTRVSSKGQLVLPAELRQQDGIEVGQEFEVERLDRGEYRLVRPTARPNEGVVDLLLSCPEKGFFVAIEFESTDAPGRILWKATCSLSPPSPRPTPRSSRGSR